MIKSSNDDYHFKPMVFTEVGDTLEGPVTRRPERRSGHRIVCDDSNFYSFGGYLRTESFGSVQHRLLEELWCFNYAENRWKLLPTTGAAPKELASHCAALYGNYLHVFGGTGASFGESTSNKLTRCDLRSLKWEEVATTGDVPEPQYGQALILDDEKRRLFVVGGTTGFGFTMDVHMLDLTTKVWTLLHACKGDRGDPAPRYRHEVGYDGDNIYIFGGGTNVLAFRLDTVPVFNIEKRQWSNLETKNVNGSTPVICNNSREGDDGSDNEREGNDVETPRDDGFPVRRKCHASVQIGNNIYISGGCNGSQVYDDIWKYHIPTREWQCLPVKLPIPLTFHTACVTPEGCMYIFGGVTNIDRRVRTSRVFKIWLKVPKLKEMCWETLVNTRDIRKNNCEDIMDMGVPYEYARRAHPLPPSGKPDPEVETAWESDYLRAQNASCTVQ